MEHLGGTKQNSGNTTTRAASGRRRPAILAALTALVALAVAGCGGSSSTGPAASAPAIAHENSGTGSRSGITGGALFGGNASLLSEEPSLGRKLAIVRDYYKFGDSFPTSTDSQIMATGSTLMVSLDSHPNGPSYASIAAGQEDGYLASFLRAMNQAAIRHHLSAIYLSFEHESALPDGKHSGLGSPAQFIQAWDHVHQLAARMHLDWNDGGRIHWVWIQLHNTFVPMGQRDSKQKKLGPPTRYWPGRNEVDIIAVDGYSHTGCSGHGGQETPEALFGPAIGFAHQNGGLPVFITEWGSTAYPSIQGQSGFIGQMRAFVAANPEIVAVLYWNSAGKGPHCNFSVDTHPASVSALATMARSTALQGHLG